MNRNIFRLSLLLMCAVVLPTTATAQKKTAQNKGSAAFEVRLPVSVTDQKKKFVAGLTGGDFVVLENGRRQKITLFSDEKNNPPRYVGILMDTSSSMKAKIVFVKRAIADFSSESSRKPIRNIS